MFKKVNRYLNVVYTFILFFILSSEVVFAFSSVVDIIVGELQEPLQIMAGLGFLFGAIKFGMAYQQQNPQAKSSALIWLGSSAVIFGIANQLDSIVDVVM